MKQSEATDTLFKLLPSLRVSDPAAVLSKYAADKGIAPAQLERLGHVYNTASTLATLEEDRNGTPYLIDVPAMVGAFKEASSVFKRASWLLNDPEPVMEKKASACRELANVWGRQPEELNLILPAEDDDGNREIHARIFNECEKLASRAVEEAAWHMSDFANATTKIALSMIANDDTTSYAQLASDSAALDHDAESRIILGKLAAVLASQGIDVRENSGKVIRTPLARDHSGYHAALKEAAAHLRKGIEAQAVLTQSLDYLLNSARHLSDDWKFSRRAFKVATEVQRIGRIYGIVKSATTMQEMEEEFARAKAEEAKLRARILGETVHDVAQPLKQSPRDAAPPADQVGGAPSPVRAIPPDKKPPAENRDKTDAGRLTAPPELSWEDALRLPGDAAKGFGGVMSSIGDTTRSYLDLLTPDGLPAKLLAPVGEANKARVEDLGLRRKQLAHDAKALGVLQRLMITDEVLASKDPEAIVEAFNTIRQASPEVAEDPSMLRLLLRQAMEFGGTDVDTATAARKYQFGGYKGELPK